MDRVSPTTDRELPVTYTTTPNAEQSEEQSKVAKVGEQTSEVVGTVREQTGALASTTRAEVSSVAGDASQQARRLVNESRQQLRQTAGEQAGRLAQTLRDIGEQLNGMASSAPGNSQALTEVTQQAGSTVRRWADDLDRRGIEGVASDVKRFARQRPGLFIAGALGAGLAVGRLIRSVDTQSIVDAAKPSAGQQSDQPDQTELLGQSAPRGQQELQQPRPALQSAPQPTGSSPVTNVPTQPGAF